MNRALAVIGVVLGLLVGSSVGYMAWIFGLLGFANRGLTPAEEHLIVTISLGVLMAYVLASLGLLIWKHHKSALLVAWMPLLIVFIGFPILQLGIVLFGWK